MSTVADYAGRVYDVAAFRGQKPSGDALLDQSLLDAESGGEICTGVQKVAQWFLIELLTVRGSVAYDPDRGTTFMQELLRGQLRSELDVHQAFSFAVGAIRMRAARLARASDPDDERFSGATLNSVLIGPGYVTLRIAVTTAAGAARKVILPIKTLA